MNAIAFRELIDSLNLQIHHAYFTSQDTESLRGWLFKAKVLRDDAVYALDECPKTSDTKHMQRALRSANERISAVQQKIDNIDNQKLISKFSKALNKEGKGSVTISYTSLDTEERITVSESAVQCLKRIEQGNIVNIASIGYTHNSQYALCKTDRNHTITVTVHSPA
ncbi:MAG: hypothetical protein JXQ95_06955 [Alteromonas stellipolaris]|uniref:hypothetical protein n=1 Tax=Alteromonas stellipolaris TaxID=233316 RepID=UPI003B8B19CE